MKTIYAIFIATLCLLGCGPQDSIQSDSEVFIKNVDATAFKELVEAGEGTVLDVRTPSEVSTGFIGSAISIDFQNGDFLQRINQLPKGKEIYVYCKVGGRSSKAAELLKKNGFNKIYHLEKGIDEWKEKSYPLIKSE